MKQITVAEWTAALRSGEWQQGHLCLFTNGKYCCLGVGAELCGLEKKILLELQLPTSRFLSDLPEEMWLIGDLGVDVAVDYKETTVCVSDLNDDGVTFAEIADAIDATVARMRRKRHDRQR